MSGVSKWLPFHLDHRWVPPHASAYIDRELSAAQNARVGRHLEDCPECRELLRSLGDLISSLGGMRGEAGELVASSILANVRTGLDAIDRDER